MGWVESAGEGGSLSVPNALPRAAGKAPLGSFRLVSGTTPKRTGGDPGLSPWGEDFFCTGGGGVGVGAGVGAGGGGAGSPSTGCNSGLTRTGGWTMGTVLASSRCWGSTGSGG